MLSFLAKYPKRTPVAHLNKIFFDEGRSSVQFKAPDDRYFVINDWPPAASDADVKAKKVLNKQNCALAPGLHWHRDQEEMFHVLKGTAKFTLDGGEIVAKQGDMVVIPMRAFHTFCNASDQERMMVEFVLEPTRKERDEAFFRNMQTYRDDCRKSGTPRSLLQVLLFMRAGGVVMALPGPRFLARSLGVLLNFFGGVVLGRWMFGYSASYTEYYRPPKDKDKNNAPPAT